MKMTQRARHSAIALVAAVAIGGSGAAIGAATADPASVAASTLTASVPVAVDGTRGVIGIPTLTAAGSAGGSAVQGIGFAIP